MKAIRALFESIFENLGLVMAPLAAATLTGVSIHHFFTDLLGDVSAGIIGFVFAFGIEATGYVSFVAYQKDKDIKKPIGYLVSVVAVVTIIELFVFQDFQRWGIGLSGVAIAGIMYWSHSASNATLSEVEELKQLAELGYKKDKNGNLIALRKHSTLTPKNTPTSTPKRLSWKTLSPEAKTCISQDGYSVFQSRFGSVPESTFYGWQKRIDKELLASETN